MHNSDVEKMTNPTSIRGDMFRECGLPEDTKEKFKRKEPSNQGPKTFLSGCGLNFPWLQQMRAQRPKRVGHPMGAYEYITVECPRHFLTPASNIVSVFFAI